MKIYKFNENVQDVNNDSELKEKYNSYNDYYSLYGELIFKLDRYRKHNINPDLKMDDANHITSGTLEECIDSYNKHNKKRLKEEIGSFDNLFIIKKEIIETLIEKNELELLVNSKKYNL